MMFVSIIVKATITVAFALICNWLARRSRASLRHALLAATFAVLLVLPIASLIAPPVGVPVPAVVRTRIAPLVPVGTSDAIPLTNVNDIPMAIPHSSGLSVTALLVMIWITGAALFLMPMAMGLWQVRSLRRSGLPWRYGKSVAERLALDAGIHRRIDVLLQETLPGPMTCGVVRPAIVLPALANTWNEEDLNRAIVHELEHVRRGDWVMHCVSRAVCAVYWFHPLVWMAWRQLALEAERACDDAVVRRSEATAYADQLVGLARQMSGNAKSPLLAMANRSDLATRVGAVLDGGQRRGRAGTLLVGLACAIAVALIVGLSPLRMVAAALEFDAGSVKLVSPDSGSSHSHENSDPGRLSMIGSMHRFIVRAYGITDGQLSGEPDWFQNRLYSIEGVTSMRSRQEEMMLMLRALLADRFHLKLREENRELPVYSLEVAPGGAKFRALKPGEEVTQVPDVPGTFAQSFTSMQQFVNSLNNVYGGRLRVDRPVVDHTGLMGRYKIQLQTAIETQTDDFGHRTVEFPNLAHDLQSEMGLKLVSQRVKMPCYVVESASEPEAN